MRIVAIMVLVGVAGAGVLLFSRVVTADQSGPITGYAWSDTIGWIDLNCSNTGICATRSFGLSADSSGVVSGYAWSDNVGWVSANAADLAGCPAAPCEARLSSSALSGWMRALSGGSPQSGGWDGFVSLSGPTYGVTRNVGGLLSGFAWGSTVIGWIDFAPSASQCTPEYSCVGNAVHNSCTGEDSPCPPTFTCSQGLCLPPAAPTASIRVSPSLVRTGDRTQVIWSASDVTACSVGEDNANITDAWSGASDTKTSSPIGQPTTYTLTCTGTDGSTVVKTATVSVVPSFQEI